MLIWLVWLCILLLQVGNGILHYAMSDPLLLKQGTRAFSFATMGAVGLGIVMQGINMPSFRALFKRKLGEDLPDGGEAAPPKSASGGFIHSKLLFLLAAIGLLGLAMACSGCCANAGSSSTCARKWLSGLYASIGVGVVTQKVCDSTAVNLATEGDLTTAKSAITKCKALNQSLHAAKDTADAIAHGITAGEKIGVNDYGGAIKPGEATLCSLNRAIADVDPKAPVLVCGGG